MNSFANSLFSLLFGWAKSLIQNIWTSAVSGHFSAFFTWLGDHWLGLALLAALLCTAMDFLIWIVRWRPYLVWRTKWRAIVRWITGEERKSARRFAEGYEGGVGLEVPPEDAPPQADPYVAADWSAPADDPTPDYVPGWDEPSPVRSAQPQLAYAPAAASYPQGGYGDPAPYSPPAPAYDAPPAAVPGAYDAPAQEEMARRRRFIPASDYELPPVAPSTRVRSSRSSDMPAARRRRRSEKYEKRKPAWRGRLIPDDEEEEGMLDGLPPAVDRSQAFYEPVYPQPAQGEGYYGWQRPPYPDQTDGSQA